PLYTTACIFLPPCLFESILSHSPLFCDTSDQGSAGRDKEQQSGSCRGRKHSVPCSLSRRTFSCLLLFPLKAILLQSQGLPGRGQEPVHQRLLWYHLEHHCLLLLISRSVHSCHTDTVYLV